MTWYDNHHTRHVTIDIQPDAQSHFTHNDVWLAFEA
jgi:hypothetical protein